MVLQHLLSDSAELVAKLINSGCTVEHFIAKPYSIDPKAKAVVESLGIKVSVASLGNKKSLERLEQIVDESLTLAREDGKRVIFLDVGGYFSEVLSMVTPADTSYILGAVEDTTFGHKRYLDIEENLATPVFSVARSRLKEVEAYYVGRAVMMSILLFLGELGSSLTGRQVLQVGYGMIGKSIAKAFKTHDTKVAVYDKTDIENLHAFLNGFEVNKKKKLLESADIVVSATGEIAITSDEFPFLKENVFLANAGSGGTEFDLQSLRRLSTKTEKVTNHVTRYVLPSSQNIYLLRDGEPVNFHIQSNTVRIAN